MQNDLTGVQLVELHLQEINTIRQWFQVVEDLNKEYLEVDDYKLYIKLLRIMGYDDRHSTVKRALTNMEAKNERV